MTTSVERDGRAVSRVRARTNSPSSRMTFRECAVRPVALFSMSAHRSITPQIRERRLLNVATSSGVTLKTRVSKPDRTRVTRSSHRFDPIEDCRRSAPTAQSSLVKGTPMMLATHRQLDTHPTIVGPSLQWNDALQKAARVAASSATVLVTGESGTGKEVLARFIHRASGRSQGPFAALNCAALPEQLFESELFGYERGAFTSADRAKPGHLELAFGGVLFLDEVGEMSLSAQAKLLRVLQEREFLRLGGTRTLQANIRVIAATNRDLRDAIDQKTFREDLFYRLDVFEIRIAPLRERPDD